MAGKGHYLLRCAMPGEKSNLLAGIVCGRLSGCSQHEHRQVGLSSEQFGDKGGSADAFGVTTGDYQPESPGKIGVLDGAERLGCAGDAPHLAKPASQERQNELRGERIVFH